MDAPVEGLRRDDPRETAERIIAWLRSQLAYERGTTSVDTPVDEVLRRGRGVCQDYAHLGCALLRAAGLAARYVSGYYPARQLAVGEAAVGEGHAWLEVLLPPLGWVGYDPTNACPPNPSWIKVGHGRDYRDVLPLRGVYFGNAGQQMQVSVTIERLPDWLGGQ
ncbi:MAG: transglutaminase family protein [Fimbriimonadaceae bacterium]|nr:transglutaminase family protein [Fimbriimonadaceae bacterium]